MRQKLLRQAQTLTAAGRYQEAAEIYRQLIAKNAKDPLAFLALGFCQRNLQLLAASAESLRSAVTLAPDDFDAHHSLALTHLFMGDLDAAKQQYETALAASGQNSVINRIVTQSAARPKGCEKTPLWRGEDYTGKTLLAFANQGLGDAIELARHLPQVKARGGRLILRCPAVLKPLLNKSKFADRVVTEDGDLPDCDLIAPLSGLSHLLYGDAPPGDSVEPYLTADKRKLKPWQNRLDAKGMLTVGFVWSGNPANPRDAARSVPLVDLDPLLSLPGVRFYSLQVDETAARQSFRDHRITPLGPHIKDFGDTAAAIEALDLVITVDTATAHVAGALGREFWLLLRQNTDARWTPPPGRPPIYPRARLFRQPEPGDWATPVNQTVAALRQRLAEQPASKKTARAAKKGRSLGPAGVPFFDNDLLRLKRCRHGLMLYYATDRYVGRSLDLYGEFSAGETDLFRHILRPGRSVLDIGANIGAHTVFFSQAVGPSGQVVAFEPQRVLFNTLCANLALNHLENVQARRTALGAQPGTASVPQADVAVEGNFGAVSLADGAPGEPVPQTSIDSLRLKACHLIKLDVEGMEGEVLSGAVKTLKRFRPTLYVENDRREKSPRLIEQLAAQGYRLYWHLTPLFKQDNYFRNSENVFGNTLSCNLLCLPREKAQTISGLKEVAGPQDWPKSLGDG